MATTQGKQACSVCGTLLADDSAFCPVCALRGAIQAQSDSATGASSELRFEHYTVLRAEDGKPFELGRGGMGVTYKAIDTHLRCLMALKIINAQFIGNEAARSRFMREARAAASVRHPNVATVFHLGECDGNYFYAMEFVDGETLEALIRRSGRLEIELAIEIVTQVAAGLTAIHKRHLVHRDIKPSNIMLSWEEGRLENVKIIDLGLAKGVTEDALSIAGGFIGTAVYASPEQFAGLGTDIRSDLYSLGVTLWEMLSGKPPFQGSVAELMDQHQHAALPLVKLRNIPEPIAALLEVMLAKEPSRRFQSPAQLQQALARVREAIGSGLRLIAEELRPVSAQVSDSVPKSRPKKHAVRWVLGAGLCLALLLVGWFFISGHARFSFSQQVAESTPTEKSVAVLPFESLSDNKNDNYFADGVQDEILNNLAKIAQLKVISRTSVMQYRGDNRRDLRQIASALGVANVLEGTVRRDGNHVRVSTELVDARSDNTIWADSYDRDLTDIFATQSQIAQQVASKLSAQLSPEERKSIEAKPTNSLEAYDLYLQAKHLLGESSVGLLGSEKKTLTEAIGLLEEATQKDYQFALAYCMMAKAHDTLYDDRIDHTPERRALGDATVNQAMRLRPDLPEVHLALAFHLYTCYRDLERARVQVAIAAQNLPNNPDLLQLTAEIDQVQGRWEKATAGLENAAILDPRNPEVLGDLAENYMCVRRYSDYQQIQDRLVELQPDQPTHGLCKALGYFFGKADLSGARVAHEAVAPSIKEDVGMTSWRVYLAMCARDFAAAEEILDKTSNEDVYLHAAAVPRQIWVLWLELVKGNRPTIEQFGAAREQLYQKVEADPSDPYLLSSLALADVALGRKEEAVQEVRRAMGMRPVSEDAIDGPTIAMKVSLVYVWANQPDLAFEQLNKLIEAPRRGNCVNYGDLKTNPEWDPLRKDPRFDKLLAELAPRA